MMLSFALFQAFTALFSGCSRNEAMPAVAADPGDAVPPATSETHAETPPSECRSRYVPPSFLPIKSGPPAQTKAMPFPDRGYAVFDANRDRRLDWREISRIQDDPKWIRIFSEVADAVESGKKTETELREAIGTFSRLPSDQRAFMLYNLNQYPNSRRFLQAYYEYNPGAFVSDAMLYAPIFDPHAVRINVLLEYFPRSVREGFLVLIERIDPRFLAHVRCGMPLPTTHADVYGALDEIFPGDGVRVYGFGERHTFRPLEFSDPPSVRFAKEILPYLVMEKGVTVVATEHLPRDAELQTEAFLREGRLSDKTPILSYIIDNTPDGEGLRAILEAVYRLREHGYDVKLKGVNLGAKEYRAYLNGETSVTEAVAGVRVNCEDAVREALRDGRSLALYTGKLHNDLGSSSEARLASYALNLGLFPEQFAEIDLIVSEYESDLPGYLQEDYRYSRRPVLDGVHVNRKGPGRYALVFSSVGRNLDYYFYRWLAPPGDPLHKDGLGKGIVVDEGIVPEACLAGESADVVASFVRENFWRHDADLGFRTAEYLFCLELSASTQAEVMARIAAFDPAYADRIRLYFPMMATHGDAASALADVVELPYVDAVEIVTIHNLTHEHPFYGVDISLSAYGYFALETLPFLLSDTKDNVLLLGQMSEDFNADVEEYLETGKHTERFEKEWRKIHPLAGDYDKIFGMARLLRQQGFSIRVEGAMPGREELVALNKKAAGDKKKYGEDVTASAIGRMRDSYETLDGSSERLIVFSMGLPEPVLEPLGDDPLVATLGLGFVDITTWGPKLDLDKRKSAPDAYPLYQGVILEDHGARHDLYYAPYLSKERYELFLRAERAATVPFSKAK